MQTLAIAPVCVIQILRGHHLLLASARRTEVGAAGFEPEQDLAPLGLAGFESFASYFWLLASARRTEVGAAGFEPAAAWSEAKYSVQTELSALAHP